MKVFISWSGRRSEALGLTLKERLPQVLPGIQTFHSTDIPKGKNWHTALIAALRECQVGVFCITPESLRSQWLLFEAGALAQHGDSPTLLTYLYGVASTFDGPLALFQATRFTREDSRQFIAGLSAITGIAPADFEAWWPAFEADVLARMDLPIEELVPEFSELFANRKTFYEPFPTCSDREWDDRLRRTARVYERLSSPAIAEVLSSDAVLRRGYQDLLGAIDRYDMHIGALLLERRDYASLDEHAQRLLEDVRQRVVDLVARLEKKAGPGEP
jgi:TIR domain